MTTHALSVNSIMFLREDWDRMCMLGMGEVTLEGHKLGGLKLIHIHQHCSSKVLYRKTEYCFRQPTKQLWLLWWEFWQRLRCLEESSLSSPLFPLRPRLDPPFGPQLCSQLFCGSQQHLSVQEPENQTALASLQAWGPLSQFRLSSTSDCAPPPPVLCPLASHSLTPTWCQCGLSAVKTPASGIP